MFPGIRYVPRKSAKKQKTLIAVLNIKNHPVHMQKIRKLQSTREQIFDTILTIA